MRISIAWLREFVDLGDKSPERIASDLTAKTALIEGIEKKGDLPAAVVVGKVVDRKKHPDADRLSVCQVDVGSEVLEIVCGAPNVAAGQTVAVATVGADLPNGIKIKRSKIRGVASNGMICAEDELGLGEGHDGIMVLEDGLELGRPFREVKGIADAVLEIDNKSITHRPDLWGHEGFARELAAIYATEFRRAPVAEELREGATDVKIDLKAPELCGRYHALVADGPFGAPSPSWVARRLTYCGLRPLGLAVDLSNYVMLEIGQPTHPFDRTQIRGGVLRIRRAGPGERLVTLEGTERSLPPDACVIADAERALAVAGVLGGQDSGIKSETTALALESAWFEPMAVRRTSVALGIRTDAVARFEKHLDPALSERAVRRFAILARMAAPAARIATTFARAGDATQAPRSIVVRTQRVRELLGTEIETSIMQQVLRRLGFGVTGEGATITVEVPPFRATRDVKIEEDIVEEIGRIHGYDAIAPCLPRLDVRPTKLLLETAAWRRASELLRERHAFAEVQSPAFQDDQVLERAGGGPRAGWLAVRNPQQQSGSRLRRSLVPWMLEFVDRNVKSVESVRLFECGRVFDAPSAASELPQERTMLAAAIGERVTRKENAGRTLRALKGCLEDVGRELGRALRFEPLSGDLPPMAHPGRVARVASGELNLGWMAEIHPRLAAAWNWRGDVAVFEIDLGLWMQGPDARSRYRPPGKFPASSVDVSFVLPFTVAFADVEAGIRKTVKSLESVSLVDEFTGSQVARGSRSLTLRLAFRASDRTLGDAEVNEHLDSVRAWLATQGATLRGDRD